MFKILKKLTKGMALALLFAGPIQAQALDCEKAASPEEKKACLITNRSLVDQQSEFKFLIGPEIVGTDCKAEEILKKMTGSNKDPSQAQLLASICSIATDFQQMTGVNPAAQDIQGTGAVNPILVDKNLASLRAAITLGLSGFSNGFAQYLEFFLETLRAQHYALKYESANAQTSISERLLFCSARKNAQSLLDKIEWSAVVFKFATNDATLDRFNNVLPKLVAALMTDVGPLSQSKSATCLEIRDFPVEDVRNAIDTALNEAIKPYFSSTSPISGMMQRRLDRLAAPAEALDAKVKTLAAQAETQKAVIGKMISATQSTVEAANDEVEAYKNSFTTTVAVSEWFDRFKIGMFLDSNGENTLTTLRETYDRVFDPACGSLTGALGSKAPATPCLKNPTTVIAKETSIAGLALRLREFKGNFEALIAGEAKYKNATKYLCAVYYCQVLPNPKIRKFLANTYCKGTNKQLCVAADPKPFQLTIDNQEMNRKVPEICLAAGLDVQYLKTNLTEATGESCLGRIADPEFMRN